ncbi:MAG: hypothetical protein H6Q20_1296 [Bacteroidetes bacterium]|nr:hypothetical protein [Bacteroidota bacterium]
MSRIDLKQIDLQFEREISHLNRSTFATHRDAICEDARQAVSDLRFDIENWVNDLNSRSIACYELEKLLETKRSVVELPRLRTRGINLTDIENYKSDVLRVIAKAIVNSYLESLFRNQEFSRIKEEEVFDN